MQKRSGYMIYSEEMWELVEAYSDEELLDLIKVNLEIAEEGGGMSWLRFRGFQYYLVEYINRGNDPTWIQDRMVDMEGL